MSTTIEWTHPPGYQGDSWNPVVGCSRTSSGCANCYAETMAARIANSSLAKKRKGGTLTATEQAYQQAVRWERGGYAGPADVQDKALPQWSRKLIPLHHALQLPLKTKRPTCYFVNSMSDLFHEYVPFAFLDQVFAVMALCPQHLFLILTKRPGRMAEYMQPRDPLFLDDRCLAIGRQLNALRGLRVDDAHPVSWPLPNVWLGTSVEDQVTADARIPHLLNCPAAVRFLSCEPLLGNVDLAPYLWWDHAPRKGQDYGPDWVIAGGESGTGARPMHPHWVRSLRDQCQAAGVPFFFKQWGEHRPIGIGTDEHASAPIRMGKKKAGNHLDGRTHLEWPKVITAQATPA